MVLMFTCDYEGVKVLITSLYHSAVISLSSSISLTVAQIRICQLPLANVLDGTKLRIASVTLWRRVLLAYKIVGETSNIMLFLVNAPLWLRLGLLLLRKLTSTAKKKKNEQQIELRNFS